MGLIKRHPNLTIIGAVLLIILVGLIALFIFTSDLTASGGSVKNVKTVNVEINHNRLRAELVTAPADLYRGLSYRSGLCPNCAMLFSFNDSGSKEFVMRDMKFPLDIIFIYNNKIIKIAANLPPEGGPPNTPYYSGGGANAVLEVNAGYAARRGIKVGDTVIVN